MDTACWKVGADRAVNGILRACMILTSCHFGWFSFRWQGWDDPSVVPGREDYGDWKDVTGFGLVGKASFFPHMEDQWQELVDKKSADLDGEKYVYCLRDEDACCVEGDREVKVLSQCAALAL